MEITWRRMKYMGNDYGDYYLISNTGEIKGIKTGKIRKKNINHEGYYFIGISLGSRENKITVRIHKAVAETFIENLNNLPEVNHKDGNKLNNNIDNLDWCTPKENMYHSYKILLHGNQTPVMCLNNGMIFISIADANRWCGLKQGSWSIMKNINGIYKHAGKHPVTNEKLVWALYDGDISDVKNDLIAY